jgi:hypothetical protein
VANAQVEKLKVLGLRHGEKAVVGLAAALCLLFLVTAVLKPTIDLTPDQVSKDAKSAQSNIERRQETADILNKIEEVDKIKNPGFEKMVDEASTKGLKPTDYIAALPWVTPEPGAGLIRDEPQLIAPTDLYAYPGRGGALVFELDEGGKRIAEDPEKKTHDEATQKRRLGKRRRRSGMMGMMAGSGYGGMMAGMGGAPPDSPEAKKQFEREQARRKRELAGTVDLEAEKAKEKAKQGESPTPEQTGPFKETTKGLRWVAITGVLDHKKMKENYLTALKRPEIAHPNYKQLDAQRQVLQPDGSWSDWEDVDIEKNRQVTWNLPENEEELAPDDVIISTLVDPLPFLRAGLWEKVHVASLVPKEKRDISKPATGGMMMGPMGPAGGSEAMGAMMGGRGPMGPMGPGMMGGERGGSMMMGGYGGMMGGGGEDVQNMEKSDADTVMIRSLDFTVEPDTTYKFRLRVAVFNPNYGRDDVTPGTNTKDMELKGPWSEPTDAVTMPADVAPYAMEKEKGGVNARFERVQFQVVRYDPKDGATVTRNFEAGPGEVIGEESSTAIPNSEGEGTKSRRVDYNSHQLVIDTAGGNKPIAPLGLSGAPVDAPAVALLMRQDGSVVLRGEYFDQPDPVRKDIDENYKRELKDSNDKKKRENSYGGMMGMMGGFPGMGGSRGGGYR